MAVRFKAEIANFDHKFLILALLKTYDQGQDIQDIFQIRSKIRNREFIRVARQQLNYLVSRGLECSRENVENTFNVKFVEVGVSRNTQKKLAFVDIPEWAPNVIYFDIERRYRGQNGSTFYVRLDPKYISEQLAISVRSVHSSESVMRRSLLKMKSGEDLCMFLGLAIRVPL